MQIHEDYVKLFTGPMKGGAVIRYISPGTGGQEGTVNLSLNHRVPVKCETKPNETKRNQTKRNETDRNETKSNETKRNRSKRNEIKRNETNFFQNEM